jgi:hypothetical protein
VVVVVGSSKSISKYPGGMQISIQLYPNRMTSENFEASVDIRWRKKGDVNIPKLITVVPVVELRCCERYATVLLLLL